MYHHNHLKYHLSNPHRFTHYHLHYYCLLIYIYLYSEDILVTVVGLGSKLDLVLFFRGGFDRVQGYM